MLTDFLPLLAAETNTGRDVVLIGLGGAIIAGVMKIIEFGWGWLTQNRADKKEEQGKVESHLEKRVQRLEAENDRCDKRVNRLNRRVRVLENSKTQMQTYINNHMAPNAPPYVEIPLAPEEAEEDTPKPPTDLHTPLPPAGGS